MFHVHAAYYNFPQVQAQTWHRRLSCAPDISGVITTAFTKQEHDEDAEPNIKKKLLLSTVQIISQSRTYTPPLFLFSSKTTQTMEPPPPFLSSNIQHQRFERFAFFLFPPPAPAPAPPALRPDTGRRLSPLPTACLLAHHPVPFSTKNTSAVSAARTASNGPRKPSGNGVSCNQDSKDGTRPEAATAREA